MHQFFTPSPDSSNRYRLIADDSASEVSFEFSSSDIPINTLISDVDLKRILDEQLLEESHFRKGMSQEEELKLLRRKMQDIVHAPPAEVAINKMLLGKRYSLTAYKSLHDKQQLLDEAIASGSGDVILGVVLFLVKTLNKKQLNRILLERPDACNSYLNYLVTRLDIAEATDFLTMLGRDQEAAMLQFKTAVTMHSDPTMKKNRLKKVFSDYFTQPGTNSLHTQLVASAINLLEWQLLENSTTSADIVNSSALETLYYAFGKHKWKDGTTNDQKNPFKFATDHQISAPQLEWVALNERAKAQAYLDLDGLFEKSKWHSIKSKQFHINLPLEDVIMRLYHLNAPQPVLNSFLSHVTDSEVKLSLAKEVKAVRSVIDVLGTMKDKTELEKYRDQLAEGTEERIYADNAIRNFSKRWSTDGLKLMRN
ncbi:unnamed protein product [Hermetia illucens]|uniref:Vps16 C-terminal domain-containing protein n=1 Tax=Hermetia illucens TaxID=343691 RepID=A0A7R8Z4B1_HERIL|nr:unnamed protein product [Hermetia illucens]